MIRRAQTLFKHLYSSLHKIFVPSTRWGRPRQYFSSSKYFTTTPFQIVLYDSWTLPIVSSQLYRLTILSHWTWWFFCLFHGTFLCDANLTQGRYSPMFLYVCTGPISYSRWMHAMRQWWWIHPYLFAQLLTQQYLLPDFLLTLPQDENAKHLNQSSDNMSVTSFFKPITPDLWSSPTFGLSLLPKHIRHHAPQFPYPQTSTTLVSMFLPQLPSWT